MWTVLIASYLCAAAVTAQSAAVTPSASQAPQMSPRAIVDKVRRTLRDRYVLPERRAELDAVLARGLATGRYQVADPAILAERINSDLEKTGKDGHLNFSFNPPQAKMLAAARNEAAPDPSGFERLVRAANHGVTELRVLPGNIRYLRYDGFMWIGSESEAALENAMRFLAGGEAIIIDIRGNSGGDSDASRYLLSHFLPPQKHLYDYYREGTAKPTRIVTLDEVPAGRVTGKPIYVLTSGSTASAAEEFVGNFRGYEVGEVVGETTTGAGYAADLVPIDSRFVLSLSVGRVVLASTGRDWEGVGITPTVPTAASQALDTAHTHALRKIAAQAPAAQRPQLEALAEGIAARVDPRTPALPLHIYAGRFGERTIIADGGQLYYQRGSRARILLIPLGGNRFAFNNDPAERVEFVVTGTGVRAFAIRRADASIQGTYDRTS